MSAAHDVLLVDLDGTVYRGSEPVPGAVEALTAAGARGVGVSYVTNNASRAPGPVRDQLVGMGLELDEDDVVTSAQAAAVVLTETCAAGAAVLVVGTEALADEVRAAGLRPVRDAAEEPAAVVQGHSTDTGWAELAEAALALRADAAWVACNVDVTLPSDRGLLPGNGAMVAALRAATDREPTVAGKPAAPLLRQAIDRAGASTPLVVGDRLDTDIAGARAVDAESLLVLTGVSTAAGLLAAPADRRPTFVAADLSVLTDPDDLDGVRVGAPSDWSAHVDDGVLVLSGSGDAVAALRALCAAAWAEDDAALGPAVRADDEAARVVVGELDLPTA